MIKIYLSYVGLLVFFCPFLDPCPLNIDDGIDIFICSRTNVVIACFSHSPHFAQLLFLAWPLYVSEFKNKDRNASRNAHATAKIKFYELRWEFSSYDVYSRRKVSQECSHSFWLALSCPNLDVKAHKHFTLGKSVSFATEKNYS